MTISFDAGGGYSGFGTSTITVSCTPTGTPKGVIVIITYGAASDEVTSVTYGGTAMVLQAEDSSATHTQFVHVYKLESSVPTGNQDAVVSVSGATNKQVFVALFNTASGDTQVEATGLIDSNNTSTPTVSVAANGNSVACVIGGTSGENTVGEVAPNSGWGSDILIELDRGPSVSLMYSYDTIGTTDVTAGITQTSDSAHFYGVTISEVAAGGGRIMSSLAGAGGLAGFGGIAGAGGGLAG